MMTSDSTAAAAIGGVIGGAGAVTTVTKNIFATLTLSDGSVIKLDANPNITMKDLRDKKYPIEWLLKLNYGSSTPIGTQKVSGFEFFKNLSEKDKCYL